MRPDFFLPVVLLASLLMTSAISEKAKAPDSAEEGGKPAKASSDSKNITSKDTDKYDVKKVDKLRKTYGGKELEPPPEKLVVTEEIWLDMMIKDYYGEDKDFKERVTIACFGKLAPITCLNFISLAKGYKKGRTIMKYQGTKVQSIVRDFMLQMGDVRTKYASGDSIFGTSFQDESFVLSHNHAGWVGMANYGPDTNGSQFYIILRSARWLDGRHVLFGKVIKGMDALQTIAQEETGKGNVPLRDITIDDCGINKIKSPYTLTADQFNVDGDIEISSE